MDKDIPPTLPPSEYVDGWEVLPNGSIRVYYKIGGDIIWVDREDTIGLTKLEEFMRRYPTWGDEV